MGLFVIPKSDSIEDLIEHVENSIDLFKKNKSCPHILIMMTDSINKLKTLSEKLLIEEKE